ncbi:MAG TPA: HAMP domain-containing sensor histidine kinase [Flavitalea sp.]|nr:HAMP domain-containing sensor histidine kinase [Flavitalea sp.]
MKNAPLRIVTFSTGLIIALIIFFQLSWLKKVFTYEEKEFNGKTVSIINQFRNQFPENRSQQLSYHIERPHKNAYLLRLNRNIPEDSVKLSFEKLLEAEELFVDCRLGLYDPKQRGYLFQFYLKGSATVELDKTNSPLETFPRNYYYLFVDFPHRSNYIFDRLDNWILSSFLLIVALVTLLVLLNNFLRQRYVIRFQRDFVNNIVHEFKTPLAVMKIASEVLNKDKIAEQPDRLRKYAGIVDSQTRHLEQQVQRILEMMRSEIFKIKLSPAPIAPRELVTQATTKLQPLIEDRKAKIKVNIEPTADRIVGDFAHLELALVNLLDNALKYSRNPEITINVSRDSKNAVISIIDNGIGIDKKYYSLLFDKFYRVPSGDIHNEKGFGLGLNFVKKVVDAHKGQILVTSEENKGTQFTMLIPQ